VRRQQRGGDRKIFVMSDRQGNARK
jgi:hypothetical protein